MDPMHPTQPTHRDAADAADARPATHLRRTATDPWRPATDPRRRGAIAGALAGAIGRGLGPGLAGWVAHCPAARAASAGGRRPALVVIQLSGAVDGLSVVVPHADPDYYRARPSIAIPPPGAPDGALPLDERFGLHPALRMLRPAWDEGRLAFVQASGSPDPTRSHFDAQDYLQTGTPGRKSTADGWLNRMLAATEPPGGNAPRALSIGATPPRILLGPARSLNVAAGAAATRPGPLDNPATARALAAVYETDPSLGPLFEEAVRGRRSVLENLASDDPAADRQSLPLGAFAQEAARLGRLMRLDRTLQAGFLAVGGWDTHANQGAARGQLANRLQLLGEGLVELQAALGEARPDTVIVVLSEFGRTVRENGNRGTDHGHGNVIWLIGDAIAGGRVHGRWPGLSADALHEGRDLAVTTDFRAVHRALLRGHLGIAEPALARIFPGFEPRENDDQWSRLLISMNALLPEKLSA